MDLVIRKCPGGGCVEWSRVETCLNLAKKRRELLVGQLRVVQDPLEVVLYRFDASFPKAFNVRTGDWDEAPSYSIVGE